MSNVAHLPIAADRYGACVRQIYVVGLDLTGLAMRAQVRLGGDVPGAPLVDLLTVTNGNAEGLRLVDVSIADGLPTSHVELVINESTMEALPYSGELGDATALAWDWQVIIAARKRRIAKGAFVILGDGVTGADSAPANRSLGYCGARSPTGGMTTGATLRFGDEIATISIDNADLVAPLVARATTAAGAAESSRASAQLAAATAMAGSRYFASRAAGEAGSVANQAFSTDDGAGNLIYYRRLNSSSVEIGRAVTPSALAAGAGAGLIGYIASYLNSAARSLRSKLMSSVDVMDFGAKGDGVTDDTAAFNAAIATRKRVVVPFTEAGYSVAGIDVVEGMHIAGEKTGASESRPKLVVRENGKAAFFNGARRYLSNFTLENLACEAAPGVLNARFYDQISDEHYAAYPQFIRIETHLSLSISYKGLFIFALWDKCRDGYYGSPTNTSHVFIQALAGSYGQVNRQNINKVRDCEVFGAFGGQAAVVASYGTNWLFEGGDFEALKTAAVRAYNITQLKFVGTWFEGIDAATIVALSNYPGTGAGCTASFDGCTVVMTDPAPRRFVTIEAGSLSFDSNVFNLVPSGMKLTDNGAQVTVNKNNEVDGAGAAAFMLGLHADTYANGRRMLGGAAYNGLPAFTLQNNGGIAASGGFLSGDNIAVGTSPKTIAISGTGLGGTCIVSGADTMGGLQFRFVKNWQGTTVQDLAPPINATGKAFTFQVAEGALQMSVDTGSVVVFTTLLN